jgi:ABC-type bacteriocin/lantibiotic exporter with double-glycine peptidase domain
MVIAAPFVNLTAYVVLWKTSGPEFALITFFWWIFLLICQYFTTEKNKGFKSKESSYNDERQKLVADMVTGAKTIKAYAWENHYLKKIIAARKGQVVYVWF